MDQEVMDGARDSMSYECHDLRVVKVTPDGMLHVLVGLRVEPNPDQSGLETAPINGFWWSIGGRRQIPKQGSELDGKFDLVHSVLQKAKTEAGIEPQNVLGLYDLGIGRTEFPGKMTYVSMRAEEDGTIESTSREVTLKYPQRTLNRNIVVMVDSDTLLPDRTSIALNLSPPKSMRTRASGLVSVNMNRLFSIIFFKGGQFDVRFLQNKST